LATCAGTVATPATASRAPPASSLRHYREPDSLRLAVRAQRSAHFVLEPCRSRGRGRGGKPRSAEGVVAWRSSTNMLLTAPLVARPTVILHADGDGLGAILLDKAEVAPGLTTWRHHRVLASDNVRLDCGERCRLRGWTENSVTRVPSRTHAHCILTWAKRIQCAILWSI
jgi:anti-sigma factor RsiW